MGDADTNPRLHAADIEAISEKVVEGVFTKLGVDVRDPISVQEDFSFLRNARRTFDRGKKTVQSTAIGVIVTAFLGLIWWALRQAINGNFK